MPYNIFVYFISKSLDNDQMGMVWVRNNSIGKKFFNRENIQINFHYHEKTTQLKKEMKQKK